MKSKTERIEIRLTQEEKKVLLKYSSECGLTISKFLIKSCLERQPQFLNEQDRTELKELKALAIHLINLGNLYHEKRTENKTVLTSIKSFLKKFK